MACPVASVERELPGRNRRHAVETVRLQAIQSPSQIEKLLETLVAALGHVPPDARPVLSPAELPTRLQRHARRSVHNEGWRAWTDERQIWFVVGKVSPTISRQINDLALHVFFYDVRGNLIGSGVWTQQPDGRWAVHDVTGSTTMSRRMKSAELPPPPPE